MPERRIGIVHPGDGRNYAVTPATFHAQYEPQGFEAREWEDTGEPYAAPAPKPRGRRAAATDTEAAGDTPVDAGAGA